MFRNFLMTAVVAVAVLLTAATESRATFSLTLTGGAPASVPIADDTTGINGVGTTGAVGDLLDTVGSTRNIVVGRKTGVNTFGNNTFSDTFSYGGLDFTNLSGTGVENGPGGITKSAAAAGSVVNNSGSSKTVTITVTETAYLLPSGSDLSLRANLTIIGSTSGVYLVTSQALASPSNADVSVSRFALGESNLSTPFTRTAASFSLRNVITLTLSNGAFVNFTSSAEVTTATPAPAGLLLAAFGIPAFGLLRRFGRKSVVGEVAVAA